jgi:BA14K-like protein
MEPTMINLKVLSTAAALALALPLVMPSASFAAPPHGGGPRGAGMHMGGGHMGGGRPGGGNFRAGGGGQRFSGGGYRRGGNFGPGIAAGVAGAVIGGALASQYYDGGYYDSGQAYYDGGYYDDGGGAVAVVPAPGGDDSVSYCMQRFRSYDPQSGTYLGNDGYRHPCP